MHCTSCYRCHSQTVRSTTTAKVLAHNLPITVEEVPCCQCPNCGAVAFSGEILLAIEEVLVKNRCPEAVRFPEIADEVSKVKVGKIVLHQAPDQGRN